MIDEKTLDALYTLQQKRAAAIRDNGTPYTIAYSEKQIIAVLDNDRQSLKTAEGSQVHPGMILEQKGHSFYVLAAADRPGHRVCDVAEIRSTSQLYEKQQRHAVGGTVEQLTPTAQTVPVLEQRGHSITVPRSHAAIVGRVVKTGSDLLEVVSARIDGAKAILSTRPYQQPEQKALPGGVQRPDWLNRAQERPSWHSSNLR